MEEPRGNKERDPEWRVGRRKALDELETVHEINAFNTLVLSSPDVDAPCPRKLKVLAGDNHRAHGQHGTATVARLESVEPEPEPVLIVLALVALGVLGRADLASLGVDACTTLSFDLDYFAGGFWWHVCIYLSCKQR
eukprot:COSAG06_NODE_17436_length_940_cov_113.564804_1_plen_137_part_00